MVYRYEGQEAKDEAKAPPSLLASITTMAPSATLTGPGDDEEEQTTGEFQVYNPPQRHSTLKSPSVPHATEGKDHS